MNRDQINELLYQALETEIGGQQIYATAIDCATNNDLRGEWRKYLDETRNHERILRQVFDAMKLDPDTDTPGRKIVRMFGESLVHAMKQAPSTDGKRAAQLVAAECVVLAETKDHQNWELIGRVAEQLSGVEAKALKDAHEEVEDQEDEHLYHTMGWSRELWIESLGLPAVLPPPEEEKRVKTAVGAARAKNARDEML